MHADVGPHVPVEQGRYTEPSQEFAAQHESVAPHVWSLEGRPCYFISKFCVFSQIDNFLILLNKRNIYNTQFVTKPERGKGYIFLELNFVGIIPLVCAFKC